ERPRLPRDVYRDVRAAAEAGQLDDVARAIGAAGEALEAGDARRAIDLLEWAKSVAARSGAVREALGVARYHAGDYVGAHGELLAYRRITGRRDQNHLLADCARALGRPERVGEYVAEMEAAAVDPAARTEGLIVLAGARADGGDLLGAQAVLARGELRPAEVRPHHLRLWYAAGDVAQRLGDREAACEFFEAIDAVDEDFSDVPERLAALQA
ncbi:MAG: hypothetical protein M3N17_08360, partial [Actinomycetota bacterium]|nr:hypothetical protein [Actinomycetota bacterium]